MWISLLPFGRIFKLHNLYISSNLIGDYYDCIKLLKTSLPPSKIWLFSMLQTILKHIERFFATMENLTHSSLYSSLHFIYYCVAFHFYELVILVNFREFLINDLLWVMSKLPFLLQYNMQLRRMTPNILIPCRH